MERLMFPCLLLRWQASVDLTFGQKRSCLPGKWASGFRVLILGTCYFYLVLFIYLLHLFFVQDKYLNMLLLQPAGTELFQLAAQHLPWKKLDFLWWRWKKSPNSQKWWVGWTHFEYNHFQQSLVFFLYKYSIFRAIIMCISPQEFFLVWTLLAFATFANFTCRLNMLPVLLWKVFFIRYYNFSIWMKHHHSPLSSWCHRHGHCSTPHATCS